VGLLCHRRGNLRGRLLGVAFPGRGYSLQPRARAAGLVFYAGIAAAGVLGGYALLGRYLRLIRSE
jgi:hypothetical protein